MYSAPWMKSEHRTYADMVWGFLEAEAVPRFETWRDDGQVDRDFWRSAGELGILGASIPEAYGGSGTPRSFDAITLYTQSRLGDSAWGFALHNYVTHYVLTYGSEGQKSRLLPQICSGDLICALAITEPGTGSDVQSIRTLAEPKGDGWLLNGAKTFISNGQTADLIVVCAQTEKSAGAKGVGLFLLETEGLQGFTRGRCLKKIGLKGQDTSELFFENVELPGDALLGMEPGRGFAQLMKQLAWERLCVALMSLGAVDLALSETVSYVHERKAFGKSLFEFQNTRLKLAEAKTKAEMLRAFLDRCVADVDASRLTAEAASMAKWWGSQVQCEVIDECLQLFGGYGYMLDYPIAHLYTDARVQKIYGGSNEIMKELIARRLVPGETGAPIMGPHHD